MLHDKIIEPSTSAILELARRNCKIKNAMGSTDFVIDFRKVNEVTERVAYPLPHIAATRQVTRCEVPDHSRSETRILTGTPQTGNPRKPLGHGIYGTRKGLMQFRVMPFDLHSAPVTNGWIQSARAGIGAKRLCIPRRHHSVQPHL